MASNGETDITSKHLKNTHPTSTPSLSPLIIGMVSVRLENIAIVKPTLLKTKKRIVEKLPPLSLEDL